MADPKTELKELTKIAEETLANLNTAVRDNNELQKKLAKQDDLLRSQNQMLEAYAHVIDLVKQGEIDISQTDDELDKILRIGLSTYKVASVVPAAIEHQHFGELVTEKSSDQVENPKLGHMLGDGSVVDPVTAHLLRWRELRKGIPSGLAE